MVIKQIIKNGPLGGMATRLADVWSDPSSETLIRRLKNIHRETAILIGTPCHHNLGDHLIANNEKKFLTDKCNFESVIEIPTRIFLHKEKHIKEHIPSHVPIFITGGGWMGDVWPEDQEIMETIIGDFPNNPIIIMPQTVYYDDIDKSGDLIKKANAIFSNVKSMLLLCREEKSYNTAIKLYNAEGLKISLAPDIGLYRSVLQKKSKERILRVCLRNDREAISEEVIHEILNSVAISMKLEVVNDSTISEKPVPVWKRESMLDNLINRFNRSSIVVTDRLHGMVFSALAGTKCMAFDNRTHKVGGVYQRWLINNNDIRIVNSVDVQTINDEIANLLDVEAKSDEWGAYMNKEFELMAKQINSYLSSQKE